MDCPESLPQSYDISKTESEASVFTLGQIPTDAEVVISSDQAETLQWHCQSPLEGTHEGGWRWHDYLRWLSWVSLRWLSHVISKKSWPLLQLIEEKPTTKFLRCVQQPFPGHLPGYSTNMKNSRPSCNKNVQWNKFLVALSFNRG